MRGKNRIIDGRTGGSFVALALGLSAPTSSVGAIEASDVLVFSRDPVMLRPRFAVSETFNDNIFSRPGGQSDLVTTLSPELNLQVGKTGFNTISLDYTLGQNFYQDRSDLNAREHTLRSTIRYQGSRLTVTGSDQVQLLSSPIGLVDVVRPTPSGGSIIPGGGGDASAGGPTTGPVLGGDLTGGIPVGEAFLTEERNVDRTAFTDSFSLGYVIGEKTGAYLQGSHSTTDYETGIRNLFDITTLRATAGFGYQAFPKTSFFGELFLGQTQTSPNVDAASIPTVSFVGGFLGARGQFTEKLTGVVRAGYENRTFSDGASAPSSPVVNMSLAYRFSTKTALSLDYSRSHDVSVQYAKQSFTADVVGLQLSQALGTKGKWRAALGSSYSSYQYDAESGVGTQYQRYSANFSLAYQIQLWLNASFGYSFDTVRYGVGSASNYDINRVTLGLAVGY